MEEISLQEKVKVLEEKVKKLEKIEKRRKTIKWIKISIKLTILIVIGIFLYKGYKYVNDNYIEPLDKIKEEIKNIKDYDLLEKLGIK